MWEKAGTSPGRTLASCSRPAMFFQTSGRFNHIAIAPWRGIGETTRVLRHLCRLIALGALLRGGHAAAAFDSAPSAAPPQPGHNFTTTQPEMAMIWVPPGTFTLRSTFPAGDDTEVTLTRGFWLGRTEVTQSQWQTVATNMLVYRNVPTPSHFNGSDRPVESISWIMAMAFCARLTELERAAGRLPDGYIYALPTEAQWEYACRAGSDATRVTNLDAVAWYVDNAKGETHPIATKQPNAWGFFDMLGNVLEWCSDWFDGYPGGRVSDPAGPAQGVYRVMRGGSFTAPAGGCRPALRTETQDWYNGKGIGMRLALVPAAKE